MKACHKGSRPLQIATAPASNPPAGSNTPLPQDGSLATTLSRPAGATPGKACLPPQAASIQLLFQFFQILSNLVAKVFARIAVRRASERRSPTGSADYSVALDPPASPDPSPDNATEPWQRFHQAGFQISLRQSCHEEFRRIFLSASAQISKSWIPKRAKLSHKLIGIDCCVELQANRKRGGRHAKHVHGPASQSLGQRPEAASPTEPRRAGKLKARGHVRLRPTRDVHAPDEDCHRLPCDKYITYIVIFTIHIYY